MRYKVTLSSPGELRFISRSNSRVCVKFVQWHHRLALHWSVCTFTCVSWHISHKNKGKTLKRWKYCVSGNCCNTQICPYLPDTCFCSLFHSNAVCLSKSMQSNLLKQTRRGHKGETHIWVTTFIWDCCFLLNLRNCNSFVL